MQVIIHSRVDQNITRNNVSPEIHVCMYNELVYFSVSHFLSLFTNIIAIIIPVNIGGW